MTDKSERRKKLEQTMKQFNKGQKNSILDFGTSHEDLEVIPTGVKCIDNFVGGGMKRGAFSIIYGGFSAGKSTLVLQQIGNAQKEGKICCYIDLEHSFEKGRALSLGINLDELILAEKCTNAEQALEIIRALCKEKVVDYFAIDSVQAMSPLNEQENKGKERQLVEKEIAELARTLSKFFRVVAPDVFNAGACVVMIGQVRIHGIGTFFTRAGLTGGEALKHWASQMIFLRQGQGANAPTRPIKKYILDKDNNLRYKTEKKKIGFEAVLKLEKSKSSNSDPEGSTISVPFVFEKGFVDEVEEKEIEIEISGTDEEKEKIEKLLGEKGIIVDSKVDNNGIDYEEQTGVIKAKSKVIEMVKDEINSLEEIGIDVTEAKKEIKKLADKGEKRTDLEKEGVKVVPNKRRRGRPKKDTK